MKNNRVITTTFSLCISVEL